MDKRIFHVTQQVEKHLGRYWTVEMMAAEAGLSVSHFQKAFREKMGMTPMAYLTERRMQKAHSLLTDQAYLGYVKEIIAQCGFSDESNFTRLFKRRFGMTPTECKRIAEELHQSIQPND